MDYNTKKRLTMTFENIEQSIIEICSDFDYIKECL